MAGRVVAKVIHTARLSLRSPDPEDAAAVTEVLRDLKVSRWLMQVPHPYKIEDAELFLGDVTDGVWVIEDSEGLAGTITVDGKIGYWLAPRAWGRGYVAEAAKPLMAKHFHDRSAPDLIAGCMTGNDRSLSILTRMGFAPDGSKDITPKSTGKPIELPMFRLTRQEWRTRNRLPFLAAPRVQTRPLEPGDARHLVGFATRPQVAGSLMSIRTDWTDADAREWINQSEWRGKPGFRLAVTLWDGRLIGFLGLSGARDDEAPTTMFAMDPEHWGRGLATEAMSVFLEACFDEFSLTHVEADHFKDNPASGRVLQKLGFRWVGDGEGTSAARLEPAPVSLYRLNRAELKATQ